MTQDPEVVATVVTVRINPHVDPGLGTALVDLWVRVVNAGGTVGFARPVTTDVVRPVADRAFARAVARLTDLAVAFDGDEPVGMGFFTRSEGPLTGHLGTVQRLMRDPARPGSGVGAAVLAALEQVADRRGVERAIVEVRAGHGLEPFYVRRGYVVDGVLPDRIRVHGEPVAMVQLSKWLAGPREAMSGMEPTEVPRVAAGGIRLPVLALDGDLPPPSYATAGDAGLDLYARVDVELAPGERAVVPTGVAVAVPDGHVGLVHPRSGLAARHGLGLVNAPGTIDAGYRGEIKVIVVNHDPRTPVHLSRGDRIAQLVLQRVETAVVDVVTELPSSERGTGGFGSTGR